MKIAVTGAQGKLGKALVERGCVPILGNILNENDIYTEIHKVNPDILIHCAALTDVTYCEEHFKEAFETNVRGTANVLDAMPNLSTLIYMSTDHVFHGDNWFNGGYSENHKPQPINYYGFTKWGGELAIQALHGSCRPVVVRTSRCYDYEWMKPTIDALMRGEEVIFTDLIKRSFMYVPHFINALMWFVEHVNNFKDLKVINISGDGIYSYYEFWSVMKNYLGLDGKIIARRTELNPKEVAPRPFRGGLDVHYAKKLGVPIGTMQSAIADLKEKLKDG